MQPLESSTKTDNFILTQKD